jgi:hypothetical protein
MCITLLVSSICPVTATFLPAKALASFELTNVYEVFAFSSSKVNFLQTLCNTVSISLSVLAAFDHSFVIGLAHAVSDNTVDGADVSPGGLIVLLSFMRETKTNGTCQKRQYQRQSKCYFDHFLLLVR